jgi:hypothetical protein
MDGVGVDFGSLKLFFCVVLRPVFFPHNAVFLTKKKMGSFYWGFF